MIEPQVDPIQAEQMFMEFVEQFVKRCDRSHAQHPMHLCDSKVFVLTLHPHMDSVKGKADVYVLHGKPVNNLSVRLLLHDKLMSCLARLEAQA